MERPRTVQRTRTSTWSVPSFAVLGALLVLGLAAVWLFVSGGDDGSDAPPVAVTSAPAAPTPSPAAQTSAASPTPSPTPTEEVPRPFVEVYNNAGIKGLADQTAAKAEKAGWKVVGVDNWYGKITASTVYYPSKLAQPAKELAKDLGIERVRPAIEPMKFDRLTVILTGAS